MFSGVTAGAWECLSLALDLFQLACRHEHDALADIRHVVANALQVVRYLLSPNSGFDYEPCRANSGPVMKHNV